MWCEFVSVEGKFFLPRISKVASFLVPRVPVSFLFPFRTYAIHVDLLISWEDCSGRACLSGEYCETTAWLPDLLLHGPRISPSRQQKRAGIEWRRTVTLSMVTRPSVVAEKVAFAQPKVTPRLSGSPNQPLVVRRVCEETGESEQPWEY